MSIHVVTLPKSKVPDFPDACVACGRKPVRNVSVAGSRRVAMQAPVCAECLPKLRGAATRRSIAGNTAMAITLIATLILKRTFWPEMSFPVFAAVVVTVAAVTFGFVLWFHRSHPFAFSIAVKNDEVKYRFTERSAAARFALKNDVEVRV